MNELEIQYTHDASEAGLLHCVESPGFPGYADLAFITKANWEKARKAGFTGVIRRCSEVPSRDYKWALHAPGSSYADLGELPLPEWPG